MNHIRLMRKKMTAKEALADYHFRLRIQVELGCSMNTICSALRGTPTRQKKLRDVVMASILAAGVDERTIPNHR